MPKRAFSPELVALLSLDGAAGRLVLDADLELVLGCCRDGHREAEEGEDEDEGKPARHGAKRNGRWEMRRVERRGELVGDDDLLCCIATTQRPLKLLKRIKKRNADVARKAIRSTSTVDLAARATKGMDRRRRGERDTA